MDLVVDIPNLKFLQKKPKNIENDPFLPLS